MFVQENFLCIFLLLLNYYVKSVIFITLVYISDAHCAIIYLVFSKDFINKKLKYREKFEIFQF